MPYRLTAQWRPGAKHTVVDCFSLHPVNDPTAEDIVDAKDTERSAGLMRITATADHMSGETIMEDRALEKVKSNGKEDPEYSSLVELIQSGFPSRKKLFHPTMGPYWDLRHDLSVEEGLILHHHNYTVAAESLFLNLCEKRF